MFNLKIYLVGLFFWLSLGAFAQSDEAIIKEIIKADHESFWNLDFDTWTTFYAHTPDVYFSMNNKYRWIGWKEVYKGFKASFDSRSQNPEKASFVGTFEDFHIKISGDLAWVVCTELHSGEPVFWQHRVFEKIDGEWKTIALSLINIRKKNKD